MLSLLLLNDNATASAFLSADPKGGIGEVGTVYVTPPGAYWRPMNNDFIGDTDKLLSGAMQAGILRRYSASAYTLQLNWRFLTPVFKQAFGQPDLNVPVGRFGDWAELNSGYAWRRHPDSPWIHEVSFGIGHVGNKGAREIHRFIHQMTKNPIDQLQYSGQKIGLTASGGYGGATSFWMPAGHCSWGASWLRSTNT